MKITANDLIRLPHDEMVRKISSWGEAKALQSRDWEFWQRGDQVMPAGDWRVWLVMAGRGYGKTRMGAEWVCSLATANPGARIALVGATITEARGVMVEGESGLLACCGANKVNWEPSLRKLTWRNGAVATLYSAAEPESLRGPQHDFAWADEIAKWPHGVATWDNLMLGLRLGERPKVMATPPRVRCRWCDGWSPNRAWCGLTAKRWTIVITCRPNLSTACGRYMKVQDMGDRSLRAS